MAFWAIKENWDDRGGGLSWAHRELMDANLTSPSSRVKQFVLKEDEVLLVEGPACVSLIAGTVEVLGAKRERQPILVRRGRILPVEPVGGEVRVLVEGDVRCQILTEARVGSKIWKPTISKITSHLQECSQCSIVLIGATDSGKSTFATYLSNVLMRLGFNVTLIDTDIGQNDLGPPGSIAMARPTALFTDLRDLSPDKMVYLGYTSVGLTYKPILESLGRVLSPYREINQAHSATIVNTDGFVASDGLSYKLEMLKLIKPHLVVAFGAVLFQTLSRLYEGQLIEATPPEGIAKNHANRLVRRMMQYNRYLASARPLTIDLNQKGLKFLGSNFEVVNRISDLSEIKRGALNLMPSQEPLVLVDHDLQTAVISKGALKDMFIGLGDETSVNGFGLISDVRDTQLKIKTPLRSTFTTLYMGIIRLPEGAIEANAPLRFLPSRLS